MISTDETKVVPDHECNEIHKGKNARAGSEGDMGTVLRESKTFSHEAFDLVQFALIHEMEPLRKPFLRFVVFYSDIWRPMNAFKKWLTTIWSSRGALIKTFIIKGYVLCTLLELFDHAQIL